MPGHFIVCGDDALAQRIIDELKGADASVVLLDSAAGLKSAGVTTAHAVIAAAAEDSVNLQVALLARRLSPSVRVVARLSNPVLRAAMSHGGGDVVLDVADLAAPSVVEALLGRNAHAISVSGTDFIVAGSAAPGTGHCVTSTGGWRRWPSCAARGHPMPALSSPVRHWTPRS